MRSLFCAAFCLFLGASCAQARVPKASESEVSVGSPLALTFYLPLKHPKLAEADARAMQTPGSSTYHQFDTVSQFTKKYAYNESELEQIESSLQNLGFTIGYVYPNHLAIEVLGTVETAEEALNIKLVHTTRNGKRGMVADRRFTLPASLEGKVSSIGGLNTLLTAHPRHQISSVVGHSKTLPVKGALAASGSPGDYLPGDFAKFYHVNALYNQGLSGRGSTIGIVTLNDFKTSDAYLFWKSIGLDVSQTRITKVDVDGGIEATSNNADGEGETDLDTEYSGALAPDAKLRVYIAPNETNANFLNGFEAAASENMADTVSTSWGQPELDYFAFLAAPYASPADTSMLDNFHEVFLEMALQGQTLFVAAGDSGSFDTVRDVCGVFGTPTLTSPVCNAPYAVDSPANDPLVTAAGGTTLPFNAVFQSGALKGFNLYVNKERAWGWDYIVDEAAEQGFGPELPLSSFFSTGGGGGVSSYFPLPWYQAGVQGITKTQPGQTLSFDFGPASPYGSESVVEVVLPAKFAGRNMPDISTNADPESGYAYIQEGAVSDFYGGTSFVAPQLNGVTALFVQGLGGRVGQLNPALYELGKIAATKLTAGDNWGYSAVAGYDNASGIGVLDANTLFMGLQSLKTAQ